MFIRRQFSSYYSVTVDRHGNVYWQPAVKFASPAPHGRNAYTGDPGDWGADQYGYTDFDDYHLAIFGA